MSINDEINDLIPSDKEELKELFPSIKDSELDFYKEKLKILLKNVHPNITWDKASKNVILKEFGEMKGINILTLLRDFMCIDYWFMYTEKEDKDNLLRRVTELIQIKKGGSLEVYTF